ncbi:MAG: acetate kinase [Caldilineaceae bacterium]|nr:acetate kinase [Caldilineaceae bacterium]
MNGSTILVINCGSSSIKFALIDTGADTQLVSGWAERLGQPEAQLGWKTEDARGSQPIARADHRGAMEAIIDRLEEIVGSRYGGTLTAQLAGIGHRVVHGGESFTRSTAITSAVLAEIERVSHLAPLHNPANVLGIKTAQALFPHLAQVAVFDTAFHQTLPEHAYLYALPYELYEQHGVRRYGFHGTSHRYVTRRAAQMLDRPDADLALISAHLGNGCSAAAVLNGRSVDTTMGLTPLEGLVMGTRSGDVDPSLHEFLSNQLGIGLADVTNLLNKKSGLLGLSGLNNDMRALEAASAAGDHRAQLAIDVFCYRLAKYLAALAVPLGRIDAMIFTGGIGENSALVRAKTLDHLAILGFRVDAERNAGHGRQSNGAITQDGSTLALVVPTNEEAMIAADTIELVRQGIAEG